MDFRLNLYNDQKQIRTHYDPAPLRSARVFITGAGSWFGQWITSFLDYSNIQWERWIKPYDRFPSGAFDYVIHLAQSPIEPVLEFARRAHCSAFLFTSSGSVYNPDPDAKSDKLAQEKAVIKSGLNYRIARCYSFIGYGSPLRYAAASFIDQALKKEPLKIYGDGSSIRTYLYMADFVAWILTIMEKGERTIYDVGGTRPITILQLAQMVNKVTGNTGLLMERKDDDIRPIYVPNAELLSKSLKLGLDAWTSVEKAIERMVGYYGI